MIFHISLKMIALSVQETGRKK